MNQGFVSLDGARVLVTGHTGFTGSWVSLWLKRLGADVVGYSLPPETRPNLFTELSLEDKVQHHTGDIRDFQSLKKLVNETQPNLILHLAAQPLVRRGYLIPQETFETNVTGTVNVMEAALSSNHLRGVLCITTDKVYKNNDSGKPFTETDELGGNDPYSASKAAAELAIASYRNSFFSSRESPTPLVAARGGNIIGGGDWSEDRLIPDFIRSWQNGSALKIRFPDSTRPWQHVLGLADGYLSILEKMLDAPKTLSPAYNLGPTTDQVIPVKDVVTELSEIIHGVEVQQGVSDLKEASQLQLDSSLAHSELNWRPRWDGHEAIRQTANWYLKHDEGITAEKLCHSQIDSWES